MTRQRTTACRTVDGTDIQRSPKRSASWPQSPRLPVCSHRARVTRGWASEYQKIIANEKSTQINE